MPLNPTTRSAADPAARVQGLVAFVHVGDVDVSLSFYALLGFSAKNVMRGPDGRAFWAFAETDEISPDADPDELSPARIMFAQASGPVVPEQQAVLFYMYARDVASLRRHLLDAGLHDGGAFTGCAGPNNGRRVAFNITHPDYMPRGELRVADPDGYCILIGQLDDTAAVQAAMASGAPVV
jgi:hypothetical protein